MNLKDIEIFWIEASDDALDTANSLFQNGKYHHSMFFLHLAVEKLLKGLFVNRNLAEPPIGHNLQNLAIKINDLELNNNQIALLAQITTFNISARYDDYKNEFRKICTKEFSQNYLTMAEEFLKWIKSRFK